MKKILKAFSLLVISLFTLSIFGWMVFHISEGDKEFGFLTKPVKFMYTFPDLFARSVEEVKSLPETFIPTPANFEPVNNLDSDFIVLTSYSDKNDTRSIVLLNLMNDSVLYQWNVENPHQVHDRIKNPLLFPDKNLVYSFARKGLRRIDSLGNVIWKQDTVWAHHAMELDSSGNIWTCSYEPVYYPTGLYKLNGKSYFFMDNHITRIDPETGEILFHKSITNILTENNLSNYLLKSANIWDPIHHNDVEPALKTTKYYNEGDVFLSFRHPSLVLHYRPETNKVLRVIEGPFISQHDVDFLNDSTLVIFNNNFYTIGKDYYREPPKDSGRLEYAGDFYSNIVQYDLSSDSFSFIGDSIFRANEIFTYTEGLMEFVDLHTFFVEEQNTGIQWILNEDSVIYKNVFQSQHEGYHHLSNWTRIIDYE